MDALLVRLLSAPASLCWLGVAVASVVGGATTLRRGGGVHGEADLLIGAGSLIGAVAALAAAASVAATGSLAGLAGTAAVLCGGAAVLVVPLALLLRGRTRPRGRRVGSDRRDGY